MSTTPEYVEKFVRFLQEATWHRSHLEIITSFLEARRFATSDIDSLMMAITKNVETNLRSALALHLGSAVPNDRSYGVRLLDYAVNCHLIPNKEHPLYALLYWILKEPRNTSHHDFTSYPYNTLVMFMTEANEALEQICRLIKPTYGAYLRTNYDEKEKKIKIDNVTVLRPNGTPLPADQKVEAILNFADKKVKTIPLTYGSGSWHGEYDARGEACGTVSCFLKGLNHGTHFVASSGSNATVSFPTNESCPHCGQTISVGTYVCPKCGKRLYLF